MQKKLIIWDFDGVIADTEKLWLINRMMLLNQEYNLKWDFATTNHYLGGTSDKTKRQILNREGIVTDDGFWEKSMEMDLQKLSEGISPTPGIEKIFEDKTFAQCIATGGIFSKTLIKIKAVGIEKYFGQNNLFTADMVKHGKPEPDIFLLAAQKMGYKPEDCIVIEDSVPGLTAALKAKMNPIAFLGSDMYASKQILQLVKALGIKNIFYTMEDVRHFLDEHYK